MRRDPEFFGDREMDLVYIAKRLRDALRLEAAFNASGVDYAIETEKYVGGLMFRSERVGAFFYVEPASLESAHRVMTGAGMKPYGED